MPVATDEVMAAVLQGYEQATYDILNLMGERLRAGGDPSDWMIRKLLELEQVKQQVTGIMGPVSASAIEAMGTMLRSNYLTGAREAENALLEALGRLENAAPIMPLLSASAPMKALFSESVDMVNSVSTNVLRHVDDAYRDVVRQASGLLLGTETRQQVI